MNGVNRVTLAVFIALWVYSKPTWAIEFNLDVLDAEDRSNVDLSRFSRAGYVMPGSYIMSVYLNDQNIAEREQTIPFYADKNTADVTRICFPASLVERLGLTEASLDKVLLWHHQQCADFSALKGMTLKGDITNGALYINAPQAFLEYSDPNWLPPSRWDNGIPGILLDYNLNADVSKTHQGDANRNASLSGTAGVNIGAWRLRGDYQGNYAFASQGREAQRRFDWSRWYAYRALPRLGASLTMGENYLYSDLFDSFRFTGVSLASDERMLPPNLRGYAPEVRGIAKTNATVTVTQQGRVIYETTVASGPFRIRDLNSAVSGRLDVRVKEQDGSEQTFSVDTANVPYLTRPGTVRYKVAMGRPSTYQHDLEGPWFGSGEFSWGIANSWSLYGGSVAANDYQSFSLGLGRDLFMLGALSADVTQSRAQMRAGDKKQGKSYRLSYSKRFDEIDSEVTFAGYRFSERDYMSMGQYLDARYGGGKLGRSKAMYTVTANKSFSAAQLSAYVTYTQQSYWDREAEERYSLSLSRYFSFMRQKNLSLNLSASRSQYHQRRDDAFYLSLSVPLGDGQSLGYSAQTSNSRMSQALSYTDNVDVNNRYRVAAGVNGQGGRKADAQFNGYYTHRGDAAEMNLNAAYSQNRYTSAGLSLQGGFTATAKGAALHPATMNGGTRLMLSTDGIPEVPIDGGVARSNRFGIAVLSNVNSYYRTDASVDINQLADDVEVSKGVVESTLTEGAIGYRQFALLKGEKALAVIALPNGKHPPFGASVMNLQGRELAIVSDGGLAYLAGVSAGESLSVSWNGAKQCQITLPEKAHVAGSLLLPCHQIK